MAENLEGAKEHDPVLEAVGFAAERFLTARQWEDVVPEVLERLGAATDVGRVYVYENRVREDGELVMDQRFEWCGPRVEGTMQREATHDFPYSAGFTHQRDELNKGRPVFGLTRDFPKSEQADMIEEGIVSQAVVPIFVGPRWWGYMGFDHCFDEHAWTQAEIDALLAAAGTLGATIYRKEIEDQLMGAEQQLFEAEAKYRALVEQIPAVVYTSGLGAEGEWLYVSPQIEAVLGYAPEEWLKHQAPWTTHMHPDDLEEALAAEASIGDKQELKLEYRMYTRDGRLLWIRDEARVVCDESGQASFLLGVMSDITSQKEAEVLGAATERRSFERRLGEAEAKFRAVVENGTAIVYMDEVEEPGDTIYVSPQVVDIFGWAPEDLLEDQDLWMNSIHPDDRDRVTATEREETVGVFNAEYRVINRAGETVWLHEQGHLVRDPDGTPLYWLGIALDVTETKVSRPSPIRRP